MVPLFAACPRPTPKSELAADQTKALDCSHRQWAGVLLAVDDYCAHALQEPERMSCSTLRSLVERCPRLRLDAGESTWELIIPDFHARFRQEASGTWKVVDVGGGF